VLFIGLSPFAEGGETQLDMTNSAVLPQAMEMDEMSLGDGSETTGLRFEFPTDRFFMAQLTDATGYVATILLGLTLLIGPANLVLRRRITVSNYLSRDVGTWAAMFSVVHVVFALQVHGRGAISDVLNYFVRDGSPLINSFGWANWTGLAALVIVVVLLALSNDRSLRELKAKRWKNLQRVNYALFALVALHAFFYGALLRTTSAFTLVLIVTTVTIVVGQTTGIWLWRRRRQSSGTARSSRDVQIAPSDTAPVRAAEGIQ
jgi:methionine sulfoxide reductase heme-binding subunit